MNAEQHKARIERFNFLALRDFSAPAGLEDDLDDVIQVEANIPPPPPPPPTYTQADLDRARLSGFEEGFQKGVGEGKAAAINEDSILNQKLQTALSKLGGDLAAARHEFQEFYQGKYHDMIGLALSVASKVAGAALQDNADTAVKSLIEQTLPLLIRQPKVTVFVHPDIKLSVETHILRVAMESDYEGKVIVTGHPDLEIADCRLEWQDGAVERSTDNIWKEILQVIEGTGSKQKRPSISSYTTTVPANATESATVPSEMRAEQELTGAAPVPSQEAAQGKSAAESAPPSEHTATGDIYDYINSHLDALDAKITNPDHPKE